MKKTGFTLPEILIVGGIMMIILALGTINLIRPQQKARESAVVDILVTDISAQQIKAMVGDISTGGSPTMYGIYFESDRYVLFKGDEYSAANTTNFTVMLESPQSFSSILFPSGQLLFAKRSGEFANYGAGEDSITLTNSDSGESKTIQINSYGVINSVN